MPRFRKRFNPKIRANVALQHSATNIANIGGASAPGTMVVLDTEAGSRTLTGTAQQIQVGQRTDQECNVGAVVKYINLFIEVINRNGVGADGRGILEWAFVCVKQSETAVPITNIGVQTLGDICTKMFRNECIYTGAFPIGLEQPNYLPIKIKIPNFKTNLRIGDEWRFITHFRDGNSTSTQTAAVRIVKSFMYKSYG